MANSVVSGHGFQIIDIVVLGIVGSLPDIRNYITPAGPVAVANKEVTVVELGSRHPAICVDLQNHAAVYLDFGGLAELCVQLLQGGLEDRLGRCIAAESVI